MPIYRVYYEVNTGSALFTGFMRFIGLLGLKSLIGFIGIYTLNPKP